MKITNYTKIEGSKDISKYETMSPAQDGMFKVSENYLNHSFIDKEGNVLFETNYKIDKNFVFDNCIVVDKKYNQGVINKKGEMVIPVRYKKVSQIGRSKYYEVTNHDNKTALFDFNGKKLTAFKYDELGFFSYNETYPNRLLSFKVDDKYGYLNELGKEVIEAKYKSADQFCEGFAKVRKDKGYLFIDREGKEITEDKYLGLYDFYDKNYAVFLIGTKYGILDKMGTVFLKETYDYLDNIGDGLFIAKKNDKYGLIDIYNNVLIDFMYEALNKHENNYLLAKLNGKEGIIDYKGNILIDFKHDMIQGSIKFDKYLIFADKTRTHYDYGFNFTDYNYGFMDRCGNEKGKLYSYVGPFKNGVAIVKYTDGPLRRCGLIDEELNNVLDTIYDDIRLFSNGLSVVSKNGKSAIVNSKGEILTDFSNNISILDNTKMNENGMRDFDDFSTIIMNQSMFSYSKPEDVKFKYVLRVSLNGEVFEKEFDSMEERTKFKQEVDRYTEAINVLTRVEEYNTLDVIAKNIFVDQERRKLDNIVKNKFK